MIYRLHLLPIFLVITHFASAQTSLDLELPGRKIDFDYQWKFFRGDAAGAHSPAFDDSGWRMLDVPHDWSIEDVDPQQTGKTIGPFSKESAGGASTGHTVGGTGWYRKTFTLPEQARGKTIKIHFDGVYMNSDVWINGHHLGNHPNGYTAFYYDLTPHLNPAGKPNTIAVRVKNLGENSRWYTGSGIYRHVWLTQTAGVHVEPYGIFVSTSNGSAGKATVQVEVTVRNETAKQQRARISVVLQDDQGKVVAEGSIDQDLSPALTTVVKQLQVSSPRLWSPETPHLYHAVVSIASGKKVVEKTYTTFGIRDIAFDATRGFLLNGKHLSLRGACLHHDNGPLGSKAIDRAEARKVELMKANGFNAIRCSHNPPSQVFLDACDRLGMLVIDEAFDMWQLPKKDDDYHQFFDAWWRRDLGSMILRDRNHPSVIMWSIGNEIKERADTSGLRITQQLAETARSLDATRPVTAALCKFWEHPGKQWDESAPAFALLDVGGYNYEWRNYETDHEKYPDRVMVGSESVAQEAYENWEQVEKLPYVIGDFVWTGMDYLGESGIGHTVLDNEKDSPLMEWPWFNGYCGDLDLCGFKKPQSYYRDVLWGRRNIAMMVHVPVPRGRKEKVSFWGWPDELPGWSWPGHENDSLEVSVYTNSPEVRLELNGREIGTKILADTARLRAKFLVPYEPGTLKAFTVADGGDLDSAVLKTAHEPYAIRLTPDRANIRADKNDLAYVTIELVDSHGEVVTHADAQVNFSVSGEGRIAAVGNGHPSEMKSFQQPSCKTFRGRCLVIVQPDGKGGVISLRASSGHLRPASISITAN